MVSQTYFALDPALASFDSNLPLVVIDTFGQVLVNTTHDVPFVSSAAMTIEPGVDGRAALTDSPAFCGLTGVKFRGCTATVEKRNFAKKNYALETRNEQGGDMAVSLLGLPEESDWVLYGPYTDKTLMRNYLSYKWSATWATTRRAPSSSNSTSTRTAARSTRQDYVGVYVLVEKIKLGENRVDIEELDPTDNALPDVTGGYIFAKDRTRYESTFHDPDSRATWVHVYPGKDEITPEQTAYLTPTSPRSRSCSAGANFADPVNGYAKYIDVDSFIDSFISVELAKNVDGYGLSSYFYKDRDGKLVAGPVWDYNLSLANAWYGRTWDPTGWKYSRTLRTPTIRSITGSSQDPNFVQAVIDRWTELRRDVLSEDRLMQDIDDTAAYLDEAQQRNFERLRPTSWARASGRTSTSARRTRTSWTSCGCGCTTGWRGSTPSSSPAPELSQDGGTIDVGAPVTASTPIGTIYYTTDGSDPRLPGGGLSPAAVALGAAAVRERADSHRRQLAVPRQRNQPGDRVAPLSYDPPDPIGDYGYPWFTVQVPWKYGPARARLRRRRRDHRRQLRLQSEQQVRHHLLPPRIRTGGRHPR